MVQTPPLPRAVSAARSREALIDAALALFARDGFDQTTTERITERAGVSPRTFFRYFPTKESVVFDRDYGFMRSFADAFLGQPPTTSDFDAVRATFVALAAGFGHLRARIEIYRAAVESSAVLLGREQEHFTDHAATIAEAIAHRRGDAEPDADAEALAAISLTLYQRALRRWLDGPRARKLADLIDEEFARATVGRLTVRRIVLYEFGPYENLVFEEHPDPTPGAGEAVVAIEAAGIGFVDTLCVHGTYQLLPTLPWVPGCELAGRVVAVGDDLTRVTVGDRVLATSFAGSFQTHTLLREDELVPIPGDLTAGQAAGLVASYGTVLYAFTRRTTVARGEWVVVLGAGGGVGLAATDVAKSLGAQVIACASTPEKLALAQRAGADVTLDYSDPDLDLKATVRELTDGGADVIVDPVGGPRSALLLRALNFEGRYVVVGFASGDIPQIPLNQVLLNDRTVIGIDWGYWAGKHPEANAQLLDELFAMVRDDGKLHPAEPTSYRLDDAARALGDLEHRRIAGKVVLAPQE